jgi:hypothetical protein
VRLVSPSAARAAMALLLPSTRLDTFGRGWRSHQGAAPSAWLRKSGSERIGLLPSMQGDHAMCSGVKHAGGLQLLAHRPRVRPGVPAAARSRVGRHEAPAPGVGVLSLLPRDGHGARRLVPPLVGCYTGGEISGVGG